MSLRPPVVLIVADDAELMAMYVFGLLAIGFQPVTASTVDEALMRAKHVRPEVVVADIVMPGKGGLAAVRQIQDRHPGTPVVFLSVIAAPSMIQISLSSGGSGYVVKDDAADELVPAIEAVRKGRDYVSSTGLRALSWS